MIVSALEDLRIVKKKTKEQNKVTSAKAKQSYGDKLHINKSKQTLIQYLLCARHLLSVVI